VTYALNDQQFEAVRTLPTQQRYEHLVKRSADWGELWLLRIGDGWVMGADDAGRECVPVWPHPRYAEASASGGWAGSTAAPITTREWIAQWTPELIAAARLVAVFPVEGQPNATIDPEAFAADLSNELALME
jgi:hypothetical protein